MERYITLYVHASLDVSEELNRWAREGYAMVGSPILVDHHIFIVMELEDDGNDPSDKNNREASGPDDHAAIADFSDYEAVIEAARNRPHDEIMDGHPTLLHAEPQNVHEMSLWRKYLDH